MKPPEFLGLKPKSDYPKVIDPEGKLMPLQDLVSAKENFIYFFPKLTQKNQEYLRLWFKEMAKVQKNEIPANRLAILFVTGSSNTVEELQQVSTELQKASGLCVAPDIYRLENSDDNIRALAALKIVCNRKAIDGVQHTEPNNDVFMLNQKLENNGVPYIPCGLSVIDLAIIRANNFNEGDAKTLSVAAPKI